MTTIPVNSGRKAAYVARNQIKLIKATQIVLSEHGQSATVDMVAAEAGIVVSTIYKHFSSKDSLFETAFLRSIQEWETWAFESLKDATDPFEKLVFPLRMQAKIRTTHPLFAKIVALNSQESIKFAQLANITMRDVVMDLQNAGLISVENLDIRIKSFLQIAILTVIELSSNPEMTEEQALLRFSIALELLGISPDKISELMALPLPNFAEVRSK